MVKATLRTSSKPASVVVDSAPVEIKGVAVESRTTACPASPDLAEILPPEQQDETSTPEAPALPVARRGNGAVATYTPRGEDEDGFDESDDKHPALRIVAGSGKLSTMFNVGSCILGPSIDESEVLFGPPNPQVKDIKTFRFVPIALRKFWRENIPYEEQQEEQLTPRIFKTKAEVIDAGGTTQWIGREAPTFKPSATCILMIEQPEGCDSALFQIELDGKLWCPAVFYAGNSAYKAFAQPLRNTAKTTLLVPVFEADGTTVKRDAGGFPVKKKYYPKHPWTFGVRQKVSKKDGKDFTVFVPEIRVLAKEESGPELRHYVEQFLPQNSSAEAEE